MNETIKKNSEILFLYDANKCNPNGDMDDENKPRMDKNNSINLVSDVRIKRYIRDYLKNFQGETLFVDNETKDSKERGKQLGKDFLKCIDIRMFGGVLAQKDDESKKGTSESYTGPIQLTWGNSLNKVELQKTKTITSTFSSQEGIGSDYRVVYSFIGVSGSINSHNAIGTRLTDEDIQKFDNAMIKAIPLCKTRSKTGQYPRFYLRLETEKNINLKDLREYVKLNSNENLLSIENVKLDISGLMEYIKKNNQLISHVIIWIDDKLKLYDNEKKTDIESFKTILDNKLEIISL
ncbi:MAG: type I-B CRISPR-associated protein Cas7/Csh2 [Nanoarchaeota archaeon]